MVVQNCVTKEQSMRVAVNPNHLRCKGLRTAIGRIGIERRRFVLRAFGGCAEYFAAASMMEFWFVWLVTKDLHDPESSHRSQFASTLGYFETETDMGLASEMVKLVWLCIR